jgi:CRISPR-associated endonuclease Cas2
MRDPFSLYLVVLDVRDASRRRRARDTLRYLGTAVARDVYEIPATTPEMARLVSDLDKLLEAGDRVRVYPVCARCRSRAKRFGHTDFSEIPDAYIF